MEYLVGIALALFSCSGAKWLGLDRDRAFYPTVVIVIASYYVLFATLAADHGVLAIEVAIAAAFSALAVIGFKRSLWLVVAALFMHGVLDWYHPALVHNAGVPATWPGFCLAFDAAAAVFLGVMLLMRAASVPAR